MHVQLLLVLHPALRLLLLLEPEQRLLRRRRPRVAVLVLLSRHRLQRLQPAWPAPCISAALASPKLAATVLVAEATEAATYPTPAAETAAFAAITTT